MIALEPVIHGGWAPLDIVVEVVYELRHLRPLPPHVLPQKLQSSDVLDLTVAAAAEEEAAEGGEEEAGLDARMEKIERVQIVHDLGWNGVVYALQRRYPGEVVAPVHFRVHVHRGERPPHQIREDLVF